MNSTMAASSELDSFILKFKSLCYNGIDSSLNISSTNGKLCLAFNVDLGQATFIPPQYFQSQTNQKPRNRSYYRHQQCRKLQSLAKSAEKVDTPSSMQKDDVTQNTEELSTASQIASAKESCVVNNEQSCIEIMLINIHRSLQIHFLLKTRYQKYLSSTKNIFLSWQTSSIL